MDPSSHFSGLLGPTLVGLGFWIFLGVTAVTGIITDYRKKQFAAETLRAAIERGQAVDPAVIAALVESQTKLEASADPRKLAVGGIICSSVGVGVTIFSFFISRIEARAFYPVIGAGVIVICVGMGILIASRYLQNTQKQ